MPVVLTTHHRRRYVGLGLMIAGEALIFIHLAPASTYYFPVVWLGYILTVDGHLGRVGLSILDRSWRLFALMLPVSAGFWWVFEGFNLAVHNWQYVGGSGFSLLGYVVYASVCFSTVLLAVWETAICVSVTLPRLVRRLSMPAHLLAGLRLRHELTVPDRLMNLAFVAGLLCVIVPIFLPHYAFGLIWLALFFLIDPINHWLGRPSLLEAIWQGRLLLPMSFALAALACGFLWEAWNYFSIIKWLYHVPLVSQWRLFEMPIPGYSGYLPFGLELFAMAVFVIPPLAAALDIDLRPLPLLDLSEDYDRPVAREEAPEPVSA